MKTFGAEARDLSYEISERELELQLLTEFQEKGGQFRLSITCDHPDDYVKNLIQRKARDEFMLRTVMNYMVKQAKLDLNEAVLKLRVHATSHNKANESEAQP